MSTKKVFFFYGAGFINLLFKQYYQRRYKTCSRFHERTGLKDLNFIIRCMFFA